MTKVKAVCIALTGFLALAGFLTASPSTGAPAGATSDVASVQLQGSPGAIAAYAIGTDNLTFDKDADVHNNWQFNEKMNAIDSNFLAQPNLRVAECENTQGPCMNVQEVCNNDVDWFFHYDRDYFGSNPKHGRLRLNICGGWNRDVSASCRSIAMILGSLKWADGGNNTCMDDPWLLSEHSLVAGDYHQLHEAYGYV